jgi:Uncharacterized protein conserved in bacteria
MKVLVDMDGVLADVYAHFIALEYKKTGIKLALENLYGKLEEDAFPSFAELVRSDGFFRTVPPIQDSIEGLKYLNDNYRVSIVSSATEFPKSLNEKQAWLNEYFPFISWKQMVFCGTKEDIRGQIMIDDHPKNLSVFEGRKILFTQPHNVYIEDTQFERIFNWKEIMNLL